MGCSGLCALDRISLNTSTERAQGHFLGPWSKRGTLYTSSGADVLSAAAPEAGRGGGCAEQALLGAKEIKVDLSVG
jgi:hypothetical protein